MHVNVHYVKKDKSHSKPGLTEIRGDSTSTLEKCALREKAATYP